MKTLKSSNQKPSRLAAALSNAREVTKQNGANVIRSEQLNRQDRELLVGLSWLQEILRGWYLLSPPDARPGDSTAWYASFWDFLRLYLTHRFGDNYCLSAESSLDLHTGCCTVPKQVIVIAPKGGGGLQELPHRTSVLVYTDPNSIPEEKEKLLGLQVMTLPFALCKVSAAYFNSKDAPVALSLIRNASELTHILLKYNAKAVALRLISAYNQLGNQAMAEDLQNELREFGLLKEELQTDATRAKLTSLIPKSPYAARIYSLWNTYRDQVISYFPKPATVYKNLEEYLEELKDLYEKDAYNSLLIEGYQVDEELILRVQNHGWNPDVQLQDLEARNAMAARGYYEAFLEVKKSIGKVFAGKLAGEVVESDLKKWYHHLFSPLMRAGILRQEDLIGYRRGQVYIRNSRHVPPPKEAILDCMEALFDCLKKEPHPAVRAVLGHYIFVYIHPYMDGNGRIGRFLMNVMFASGGYPWTIVRVKNRSRYLNALEIAGVDGTITPFAEFIADEMQIRPE